MDRIELYRSGALLVEIKPDADCTQTKTIMGENAVNLNFELSSFVAFRIGDGCTIFGEEYKVFDLPVVTKVDRFTFRYTMKLLAAGADLAKVQLLSLGSDNTLKEPQFSLMGNADTFIHLILQNTGRFLSGWAKGEVIATDYKNLSFSGDSCLSALAKVAEAFSTEWWIEGRTIHLTKRSRDTGITFRHGRGRGLYEIQRQPTSGTSVITRLYPFGGNKNLPSDYGSDRLRLRVLNVYSISSLTAIVTDLGNGSSTFSFAFTPPAAPGAVALTIRSRLHGATGALIDNTGAITSPRTLTLANGSYDFYFITEPFGVSSEVVTISATFTTPVLTGFPAPYIERNVAQFGVIEATQIFEDIYPRRTGAVTAVDATNVFTFRDTAIDFNVNDQLLPGLAAKVVFNTGQLSGYQFEIASFNNSTKEFKLLKNKDETQLDLPSDNLRPAIGDTYVLVDMKMPASYITAAEQELLIKAQAALLQSSDPQYTWSITIDPAFVRQRGYLFSIGDQVWITDTDLEIDKRIRVVNTIRKIEREEEYQLQLAEAAPQGTIAQINNNISSAQAGVQAVAGQLQNAAIFNGRVIGDLVFEQGTAVMKDMPTTGTTTGFEPVYRENSTGKLYRKV